MITVHSVFREHYDTYLSHYTPSLIQAKTAKDILNCKTNELGAHSYGCDTCGHQQITYNSCRNRHCTLCQGVKKEV